MSFKYASLMYAYDNINNNKYKYLITKQKTDFDIFNYIDIEIIETKELKTLIKLKIKKDIQNEYDKILYAMISYDNDYICITPRYEFLLNKNIKNINIYVIIQANKNYPNLLDIELSENIIIT